MQLLKEYRDLIEQKCVLTAMGDQFQFVGNTMPQHDAADTVPPGTVPYTLEYNAIV